jgi:hypothetical protein
MMTLTDIRNQFLRNIGADASTDTAILAEFKANLNQRYAMVLARMKDYVTQKTLTSTTVAAQQYYHYPQGVRNIESIVVTVGTVHYPTTFVNAQWQWDWLNALQVQPTAIPQFIFPRRDDFGIYPIPQDAYTIDFNFHYRDRGLTIEDYTGGTVTVANGSTLVTVDSGTYTAAMAGRFFEVTSETNTGQGYMYHISDVPTAATLTLENGFEGADGATLSYRIGQVPEIPEEGHIILVDGVTADFYSGPRHDISTATFFNNKFWTGDGTNNSRKMGDNTITGGLIGLYNQYADRNSERIIDRNKRVYPFLDQNWGMNLT